MKKTNLPVIILFGFVFLLTSCIDIESKIVLTETGSGTIEFTYTVSSVALSMDEADGSGSFLPIPVGEVDFRRTVLAVPGLSLQSYSRSASGDTTIIKAALGFTDISALNLFVGGDEEVFSLKNEGAATVFSQTVTSGGSEEVDARSRAFLEAFFKPYNLKFSLTAPRAIKKSIPETGNVSGRDAKISYPLIGVVDSREPIVWRVEW